MPNYCQFFFIMVSEFSHESWRTPLTKHLLYFGWRSRIDFAPKYHISWHKWFIADVCVDMAISERLHKHSTTRKKCAEWITKENFLSPPPFSFAVRQILFVIALSGFEMLQSIFRCADMGGLHAAYYTIRLCFHIPCRLIRVYPPSIEFLQRILLCIRGIDEMAVYFVQ